MNNIYRDQQFPFDEDMPSPSPNTTPSVVNISSDEEGAFMVEQPVNPMDWVLQRNPGHSTAQPIPVPACRLEQFSDLEDGLLPIEGFLVEGELPSPILDVDDYPLFQLATPSSSGSRYASSGSYSMNSLNESASPMSATASSVSTFITESDLSSGPSSGSTFNTMPTYPCGSMITQPPMPFPGRNYNDNQFRQTDIPTYPTTETINYRDEITFKGIDFCTVCGKTYEEIVIDATERYVWGAARPCESNLERNARRRGFINGLEAGVQLFRTSGLSQPASCDNLPHAVPHYGPRFDGSYPTWN